MGSVPVVSRGSVLLVALPAINRTALSGLEGNLALLTTVCTDGLMHFPWGSIPVVIHYFSPPFLADLLQRSTLAIHSEVSLLR